MSTKINNGGKQQPYIPKGNGDESGEYRNNETGINKGQYNAQVVNNYYQYNTKPLNVNTQNENAKKTIKEKINFKESSPEQKDSYLEKYGYNKPDVNDYLNKIDIETNKGFTDMHSSKERETQDIKFINDEINKQRASRKIKYEKKAIFILGLLASGKSSVANPLINKLGAYEIDPDIFKENYIPEYNVYTKGDGIGVSRVHKESSDMAKEMQRLVASNGANIVVPTVGGNVKKTIEKISKLTDLGYSVDVVLAQLPLEKALQRNMSRYEQGKAKGNARLVRPDLINGQEGKPIDTYEQLKESNLITNYGAWSTDVNYGEKPILIEKSDNMLDL